MTAMDDLVTLLESAGFTVAPPGDNTTAPPCVVVSPVRLQLQPGGRLVYHEVDLLPTVPATPWETQYPVTVADTQRLLLALAGTNYQIDPDVPHETNTDRNTPVMFHRVNIRFAAFDLCPVPTP